MLKLRGNSNLSSLERRDSPEEREKAGFELLTGYREKKTPEIEVSAARGYRRRRRWEPRSCVGQPAVR